MRSNKLSGLQKSYSDRAHYMNNQKNCCKKFYFSDVSEGSFSRKATYPAILCFRKIDCADCPFYEEKKEEIPTPEQQRLLKLFVVKDLKNEKYATNTNN